MPASNIELVIYVLYGHIGKWMQDNVSKFFVYLIWFTPIKKPLVLSIKCQVGKTFIVTHMNFQSPFIALCGDEKLKWLWS